MVDTRTILWFVALLVVLIACGSTALAQSPAAVTPAQEAAIKELSVQWSTAYLESDTSIPERIWAADFVSVTTGSTNLLTAAIDGEGRGCRCPRAGYGSKRSQDGEAQRVR